MSENNRLYWVWLAEKFGVASQYFPTFLDKFSDPYDVYRMEDDEINCIEGISQRLKDALCDKDISAADQILRFCAKNGIKIIGYYDDDYPQSLKTIQDPPVVLYCFGKLPKLEDRLCVGIVGTRKMSEYGMKTAYKISYELAASGACIISGLALGIDGVSACAAMESGGETVAVIGSGFMFPYPSQHKKLMRQIGSHGAIITEYPPNTRPYPANFPKRNRLISGLSQATVVVECAAKSGALITAADAIRQGREVFAVPGKVNDRGAEGPNTLIKSGAYIAMSSEDIIKHYRLLFEDRINYTAWEAATHRSELCEEVLIKYGVSSEIYGVRPGAEGARPDEPRSARAKKTKTRRERSDVAVPALEKTSREDEDGVSDSVPSRSPSILESLDSATRRIYELLPDGRSFCADDMTAYGISVTESMTAFTLLEVLGAIRALPGGKYEKII